MAMTLEQAAQVLGVPVDADKKAISDAYRKAVAKYHPDANRNKSPEEQARAEKMFKLATYANKIMLNPSLAAQPKQEIPQQPQQPAQQTGSGYRPQGAQQVQAGQTRPTTTYYDNGSSAGASRASYNKATSFMGDEVDHVVDEAEYDLHAIYEADAKEAYSKTSDVLRATPSMMISIAFFVWAVTSVVTDGNGIATALSFSNSFIWLAIICLLKMATYDLLLSYYLYKLISKARFTWSFIMGLDTMALGVATFALLSSMGGFAPLGLVPIVLGAVFLVMGVSMKRGVPQGEPQQ